jgi:hypothetical protein
MSKGKHVGLRAQVESFLEAHGMTIQHEVSPGEWLWEALSRSMVTRATWYVDQSQERSVFRRTVSGRGATRPLPPAPLVVCTSKLQLLRSWAFKRSTVWIFAKCASP